MSRPFRRAAFAGALTACAVFAAAPDAWAWGATGHRLIGQAAVLALPADLPAFLRSPEAVQQIGELAREPDRSKGSGKPHDPDLDPAHFIDLTEDGHVYSAAGPEVTSLPPDRNAFDFVLNKAELNPGKTGWLPYEMMDGYQQLVRDFAIWRVDRALARNTRVARERTWYLADILLRQEITKRDLGFWAHFVGDGSQPLHTSIHYNGWGKYPNPHGYTDDPIHGPFEGAYVGQNLTLADVRGALPAPADCAGTIQACTVAYLQASLAKVEPLYVLWSANAFSVVGDARGKAFAVERVAAGAAELRDLTVRAWRESAAATVGYRPLYKVSDIENGQVIPFGVMHGDD